MCARIARADGAGLAIAVLDSAAECEFFYPKLKYFLELDGKPFEIRMLPGPPRAADSDAARFDAACERIGDAARNGRRRSGGPPAAICGGDGGSSVRARPQPVRGGFRWKYPPA